MSTTSRRRLAVASGIGLAAAIYLLRPEPPPRAPTPRERLSLRQAMSPGSPEGFERAVAPRPFSFPADHGPHPPFQIEWWYFTGNLFTGSPLGGDLATATSTPGPVAVGEPTTHRITAPVPSTARGSGGRFGYQLTFFRSALRPPDASAPIGASQPDEPLPPAGHGDERSAWRSHQVFMAHFAVTDGGARRFHAFERFARGALGLAGARGFEAGRGSGAAPAAPLQVWLEDWAIEAAGSEDLFPLHLRAAEAGVRVELTLAAGKPVVLQGEAGLSRKGPTPGNASYYYSFTRLPTHGFLEIDGRRLAVVGSSWLDREWSTSALEAEVVGWDWFALQLADGRDLMYYRLRRADGRTDPASGGTLVEADGSYRGLGAGEIVLGERGTWRSGETGVVYPAGWRLTSATAEVELTLEPLVDSQEHTGSIVYWEGAVDVSGTSGGDTVEGVGYVELTGYPIPPPAGDPAAPPAAPPPSGSASR